VKENILKAWADSGTRLYNMNFFTCICINKYC
jgi:hypothetical protein